MRLRSVMRVAGTVGGLALGAYAASVVRSWMRCGQVGRTAADADELLDRLLPDYDVIERHQIRVGVPAALTLAAAKELDLTQSRAIRAIFRARELILGATRDDDRGTRGLIAQTQSTRVAGARRAQ